MGSSQHLNQVPPTFLGSGAIKSLTHQCEAMKCRELFINAMLSPVQHRNLEKEMNLPVLDRLGLIIKIFAQRAQTREAKLQVCTGIKNYLAIVIIHLLPFLLFLLTIVVHKLKTMQYTCASQLKSTMLEHHYLYPNHYRSTFEPQEYNALKNLLLS